MEESQNGAGKTFTDAFGQVRNAQGAPVAQNLEVVKTTDAPAPGTEQTKDDKKPDVKTDDIENHPVVVALKGEIEKVKNEYGGNLKNQGKVIDQLNQKIKDFSEGKGETKPEPLFKDIKRVKDLPKEQQDAMTENEKRLFDENADIKDTMNKNHIEAQEKAMAASKEKESETSAKNAAETLKTNAQSAALAIAANDNEVANKILSKFNQFAGNDQLDEAGIKERIAEAAKLVPEYKPQKEQKTPPKGNTVKSGTDDDPFGVNKIVEEAAQRQQGNYSL